MHTLWVRIFDKIPNLSVKRAHEYSQKFDNINDILTELKRFQYDVPDYFVIVFPKQRKDQIIFHISLHL